MNSSATRIQPSPSAASEAAVPVRSVERVCTGGPAGSAIRALAPFRRGALIGAFGGQVGHQMAQHTIQIGPDLHLLDEALVGYLLHSCSPNCVLDVQRLEVLAVADIEAGAFLTIDYAVTEDRLYRQFACVCGAPNCRRWVTGRREGPSAEGLRFLATPA